MNYLERIISRNAQAGSERTGMLPRVRTRPEGPVPEESVTLPEPSAPAATAAAPPQPRRPRSRPARPVAAPLRAFEQDNSLPPDAHRSTRNAEKGSGRDRAPAQATDPVEPPSTQARKRAATHRDNQRQRPAAPSVEAESAHRAAASPSVVWHVTAVEPVVKSIAETQDEFGRKSADSNPAAAVSVTTSELPPSLPESRSPVAPTAGDAPTAPPVQSLDELLARIGDVESVSTTLPREAPQPSVSIRRLVVEVTSPPKAVSTPPQNRRRRQTAAPSSPASFLSARLRFGLGQR